jgi:hypothetical protein
MISRWKKPRCAIGPPKAVNPSFKKTRKTSRVLPRTESAGRIFAEPFSLNASDIFKEPEKIDVQQKIAAARNDLFLACSYWGLFRSKQSP